MYSLYLFMRLANLMLLGSRYLLFLIILPIFHSFAVFKISTILFILNDHILFYYYQFIVT